MVEKLSYREIVDPIISSLKITAICGDGMALQVTAKAAEVWAEVINSVAEIADARVKVHLHWTAISQQIDIYSVYLSGMFAGVLIGLVIGAHYG